MTQTIIRKPHNLRRDKDTVMFLKIYNLLEYEGKQKTVTPIMVMKPKYAQ